MTQQVGRLWEAARVGVAAVAVPPVIALVSVVSALVDDEYGI